jgi:hypothetical protein
LRCGPIRTGPKRSGYGPLISGSVYTGCGCQLPRFEVKNRTRLDFKTLTTGGYLTTKKSSFSLVTDRLLNLDMEVLASINKRLASGERVKPETEQEKECFQLLTDLDSVGGSVAAFLSRLFFVLLIQSAVFIHILRS